MTCTVIPIPKYRPNSASNLPIESVYNTSKNSYLRGYQNKKKRSGAKKHSRGLKSTPGGKKKCSREHLSRALLRSVLFLAIYNKVAEANNHTSYLSPLLHHYCRHCAVADSSPTPPPTPPTPSPPAAAGQRPTPRCH